MYIKDDYCFLFMMFSTAILLGGVVVLLGMPGSYLFLIFDYVPSLFLGGLHGDNIMPAGMNFSFSWPFVVLGAYLLSKLKIKNIRKVAVAGKFNIVVFLVLLIFSSVCLATVIHLTM